MRQRVVAIVVLCVAIGCAPTHPVQSSRPSDTTHPPVAAIDASAAHVDAGTAAEATPERTWRDGGRVYARLTPAGELEGVRIVDGTIALGGKRRMRVEVDAEGRPSSVSAEIAGEVRAAVPVTCSKNASNTRCASQPVKRVIPPAGSVVEQMEILLPRMGDADGGNGIDHPEHADVDAERVPLAPWGMPLRAHSLGSVIVRLQPNDALRGLDENYSVDGGYVGSFARHPLTEEPVTVALDVRRKEDSPMTIYVRRAAPDYEGAFGAHLRELPGKCELVTNDTKKSGSGSGARTMVCKVRNDYSFLKVIAHTTIDGSVYTCASRPTSRAEAARVVAICRALSQD